jgi:hypothetical protein
MKKYNNKTNIVKKRTEAGHQWFMPVIGGYLGG